MKFGADKFGEKLAWQWWETAVGSLSYGFNRCLAGDNKIELSDGSFKTIKDLFDMKEAFSVIGYNEETGMPFENLCQYVIEQGEKEIYELTLSDGKILRATGDHKVLTLRGYIELQNLNEDDEVLTEI
jgi:replicative DNA helicase